MKYETIKDFILQAIGEQFCTVEGMLKFVELQINAEINRSDFDQVLYRMQAEDEIVRANNGALSAYFPADKIPTSYFRAGNGKIDAFYDGERSGLPVMVVTPDEKASYIEEIAVIPYFTKEQLALIENHTAQGRPKREIANELAVDEHLFNRRARFDLPTRTAIAEGIKRKRNAAIGETTERSSKPQKDAQTTNTAKTRQRVVDIRPFARVIESKSESESETLEERIEKRQRALSKKRLCGCGNPLGARVNECRECWLKMKHPETSVSVKKDSAIDRKIKNAVAKTHLEPKKISEILLDVFLEFSPEMVKEKFAEKLFVEILEASREAAA